MHRTRLMRGETIKGISNESDTVAFVRVTEIANKFFAAERTQVPRQVSKRLQVTLEPLPSESNIKLKKHEGSRTTRKPRLRVGETKTYV